MGVNVPPRPLFPEGGYGNLHTGLGFTVAGIRVDVLYTQEDLLPTLTDDLNETSTVIRVTAGGQRILFLADMGKLTADRMLADLPASELKSDIVQVAHHGYEGASLKFYQTVNPETLLWPMNIVGRRPVIRTCRRTCSASGIG